MRTISKCRVRGCGEPLQASITIYLKDVVLKEDGSVLSYNVDHATDTASAVAEMVSSAEGDELTVYCNNDHSFDVNAMIEAFAGPEEEPLDSPSLEDTTFNHADPRNR